MTTYEHKARKPGDRVIVWNPRSGEATGHGGRHGRINSVMPGNMGYMVHLDETPTRPFEAIIAKANQLTSERN